MVNESGVVECEKIVKDGGHPYDAEQGDSPTADGEREIYTLPSHRGRIASPAAAVKPFPLLSPEKG